MNANHNSEPVRLAALILAGLLTSLSVAPSTSAQSAPVALFSVEGDLSLNPGVFATDTSLAGTFTFTVNVRGEAEGDVFTGTCSGSGTYGGTPENVAYTASFACSTSAGTGSGSYTGAQTINVFFLDGTVMLDDLAGPFSCSGGWVGTEGDSVTTPLTGLHMVAGCQVEASSSGGEGSVGGFALGTSAVGSPLLVALLLAGVLVVALVARRRNLE